MKKFKKILSLILAVVTMMSLTACFNPDDGGEEIDEGRTQIYIANYQGGVGELYLKNLKTEYEILHPEVQVMITTKLEEFQGDTLLGNMPYDTYDLYFLGDADYKTMYGRGYLRDMTTVVNEKVYDDKGNLVSQGQGTKSILDRMYPEFKSVYGLTEDGQTKYYGLPHFAPVSGLIYDADFFNDNNWFFDKDGKIGVKNTDANIGPGPDGDYSTTYDNGEPPTWEHFMQLVKAISRKGYTAFTWSGTYEYPKVYYMQSLYVNYEGKDNANLLYTLDGEHSYLGEINPTTGKVMLEQKGIVATVKAVKDIIDSGSFSGNAFKTSTQTHTVAQAEYISSILPGRERIAMFLEASYWENEARLSFDELSSNPNWAYGKRNFAFMTPPRFVGTEGIDDQTNNRTTLYARALTNFICMGKNGEQPELAEDFLQFFLSRSSLISSMTTANSLWPYEVSFTDSEISNATPFMKDVIETSFSDKVDIVFDENFNFFRQQNSSYFTYMPFRTEKIDKIAYLEAFSFFHDGKSMSDYLQAIKDYGENWPVV